MEQLKTNIKDDDIIDDTDLLNINISVSTNTSIDKKVEWNEDFSEDAVKKKKRGRRIIRKNSKNDFSR